MEIVRARLYSQNSESELKRVCFDCRGKRRKRFGFCYQIKTDKENRNNRVSQAESKRVQCGF